MTGILCAFAGIGGQAGATVNVGSLVVAGKITTYYYGYDGATGGPGTFGSITNGTYSGATIKAIFSTGFVSGSASSYTVIFSGNRSGGFFSSITIAGTLLVGTIGSPSYNSTNNETTFVFTLDSSAATLFGTTDGVDKSVVIA